MSPHRNRLDQRAVLLKMLLEIFRAYCAAYFKGDHFGSRARDLMLCASVLIGQVEGRPMNASKLADFAGLPRPTTIRRLAMLQRLGLVERRGQFFFLSDEIVDSPEVLRAFMESRRHVISAAAKLSRMDSGPIAGDKASRLKRKQ